VLSPNASSAPPEQAPFEPIWTLGLAFLALPTFILVLNAAAFLFGLHCSPIQFWIGLALASSLLFFRLRRLSFSRRYSLLLLLAFWIASGLMVALACAIFDSGADGLIYHQQFIILLRNGWNPYWEPTCADGDFFLSRDWPWIYVYTKGAEFVYSSVYAAFNHVEAGKAIHWVWYASSFLLSWCLFYKLAFTNSRRSLFASLAALIAASNPVLLCQVFTYYVDGDVAAAMLCLLSAFGLLMFDPRLRSAWLALACATICLINFKMYCLLYLFIFLVLGAIAMWHLRKDTSITRKFLLFGTTTCALGVLIGFNPYFSGAIEQHNPLFVLKAAQRQADLTEWCQQTPVLFRSLDPLGKLAMSLFCRTCNDRNPIQYPWTPCSPVEIMPPFAIGQDELTVFSNADTRIGGFGPWFGEILVVSVIACGLCILFELKAKRFYPLAPGSAAWERRRTAQWLSWIVIATTASNPACWWARYVPQLWLLPLLLIGAYASDNNKKPAYLFSIVACLCLIDCGLVARENWTYNWANTKFICSELSRAKRDSAISGEPVWFFCEHPYEKLLSILVRLRENGVRYSIVAIAPDDSDIRYNVVNLLSRAYMPTALMTRDASLSMPDKADK
jgi:hypothetical protein